MPLLKTLNKNDDSVNLAGDNSYWGWSESRICTAESGGEISSEFTGGFVTEL